MEKNSTSKISSSQIFKWIRNSIILILGSAIIGTILLILVALIPQSAIYDNVMTSSEVLYEEGTYPSAFSGSRGSQLDNWTDSLMINTAYISSGNILEDALLGTRVIYDDEVEDLTPVEELYKYLYEDDGTSVAWTYGRYWHGYLVYLKPLLVIMSLPHIRSLNMFLQLGVIFLLFYILIKKQRDHLCIPVFVAWICMCPAALFMSLQFSSIFYPTMLLSIVLVWKHEQLSALRRCMLFELCGVLVAYLDLLTYPLVALGVPLILFIAMDYDKIRSLKERVVQVFIYSVSWMVGYGCMWASKWVIASALTGQNVISNAFSAIENRTSRSDGDVTYSWLGVIYTNLSNFKAVVPVAAILLAVIVFAVLWKRYRKAQLNVPASLAIMAVSLFPFIWYLVLMNHSGVHHWFTYRELVISILGVLTLLFVQLDLNHKKGLQKRQ